MNIASGLCRELYQWWCNQWSLQWLSPQWLWEKGSAVLYQVRKLVFLLVEGALMEWEMPAALLLSVCQRWLVFLMGSPLPSSVPFCSWWVLGHRLQEELPALLGLDPTWDGYLLGSATQWEGCADVTKPRSSPSSRTWPLPGHHSLVRVPWSGMLIWHLSYTWLVSFFCQLLSLARS